MASEGGLAASVDASMKGDGSQTTENCGTMQQNEKGEGLSPQHETGGKLNVTEPQHAEASCHSETASQTREESLRNEICEMDFDSIIEDIAFCHNQPGPDDQKEFSIKLHILKEKYKNLETRYHELEEKYSSLETTYLNAKENQKDRGSVDSGYSSDSYSSTPIHEHDINSSSRNQRHKSQKVTKTIDSTETSDAVPTSSGIKRKAIDGHKGSKKTQKTNKHSNPSSSIDNAVTTDIVVYKPRGDVTSSVEDTRYDKLSGEERREQFRTIVNKIEAILAALEIAPDVKNQLLGLVHNMRVMYEKQTRTGGYKRRDNSLPHPRNAKEVLPLLRSQEASTEGSARCEEDDRPWLGGPWSQIPQDTSPVSFPGLLIRITDYKSECRIVDPSQGIVSTASDTILHTRAQRRQAIERHINWANKNKTPFISASKSLTDIRETYYPVFQKRQVRHGTREEYANCVIIGINCYARRANKMPTLQARMEMKYYNAKGPIKYGGEYAYRDPVVRHEWLLPYLVSPNEIFAVYRVLDMEKWCDDNDGDDEDFFDKVMVRDFLMHEKARVEGRVYQHANCIACGIAEPHMGCGSSKEMEQGLDDGEQTV